MTFCKPARFKSGFRGLRRLVAGLASLSPHYFSDSYWKGAYEAFEGSQAVVIFHFHHLPALMALAKL